MKIGILSKRTHTFVREIKDQLTSLGHDVEILTAENLCINDSLLNKDFYILKSKQLFFLYAGYFLVENNIPVIPDPYKTHEQKNRIDSKFLIKQAGLETPDFYLGTLKAIKSKLKNSEFPLILKPIVGSGSRGIKVVNSITDLDHGEENDIMYLEKYLKGTHYTIYFIGDDICTLEKKPLENEHSPMKLIPSPEDIIEVITKWKNCHDLLFGHLDIVRESSTNKLHVVDPGAFPEFTNWKCKSDPASKICNLILERVKNK